MAKSEVYQWPVDVPKWREHVNAEEKQRLNVIEERLERKQATVSELVAERHAIMRRCIMRARRAK